MARVVRWLTMVAVVATAGRGWAAPPERAASSTTTASSASSNDVERLEALLDEVDQLDTEMAALASQAAASRVPAEQSRLRAQLEAARQRRAALTAQLEPLLPAYPKLQQQWNRRKTLERTQVIEEGWEQQLQRHESVLDRDVNSRLNKR